MKLSQLKEKNILILGFGREGKDALELFRFFFPKKIIAVADLSEKLKIIDKRVKLHLGKEYLKAIKNYDVIIRSPGIAPKLIKPYLTKKQILTSCTEIFLNNCLGKVIGITGTKGKSTTSHLIYNLLKKTGLRVHLVGNVERPALKHLKKNHYKDIYVYEMSSHQLYGIKKSPFIAVILNISQAHLDYFNDFNEYVNSKANITLYQKEQDFLIYNTYDEIVRKIAKRTKAQKIAIKGKFYSINREAAIKVGELFNIPKEKAFKIIKECKNPPYRLEKIGTYQGIEFYNDSASTVPNSTQVALSVLGKKVETIILGGYDSKVDYSALAKEISKSKVKNLIFFPPSGIKIWKMILKFHHKPKLLKYFFVDSMKKAVEICYKETKKNKICLLSPGAPSFGIFKNYKERGKLFTKYVKKYINKKRRKN